MPFWKAPNCQVCDVVQVSLMQQAEWGVNSAALGNPGAKPSRSESRAPVQGPDRGTETHVRSTVCVTQCEEAQACLLIQ